MGYTHYHSQATNFTDEEWQTLCEKTGKIIEHCQSKGIEMRSEFDEDIPPEVNEIVIRFNGVEDDGHETFLLHKQKQESFSFCKTACKPYDLAVCLCLIAAHEVAPGALRISSDGDWESDWEAARQDYEQLFGKSMDCVFSE